MSRITLKHISNRLYVRCDLNMGDTKSVDIISVEVAVQVADIFSALADPSRLRIISALTHERLSVSEICEMVGMSQPAVSHHLRLLRDQRIVRADKDGKHVYYCLDDAHIHDLLTRAIAHTAHN